MNLPNVGNQDTSDLFCSFRLQLDFDSARRYWKYRGSCSPKHKLGVLARVRVFFKGCLNRDRTLERAILVHLTPGCQEET